MIVFRALPHLNAAYNLARWLTRDGNDAEDGVQDTCVRALKYVGSLNGGARALFLTIVRHAFYDWCKRNRPAEIARDDNNAIDMAVDPAAVLRAADVRSDARVLDQQLVRSHRSYRGLRALLETFLNNFAAFLGDA